MLIDTHSHIYTEHFDEDRDEIIQRALNNGVGMILLPNVDVDSIEPMLQIEEKYPDQCLSMMGLHPTSVDENYKEHLDVMYGWLNKHSFCAIGEIGIDLYWDKTYAKQQIEAFKIQIDWAKEFKLPIVIHARDAFDEVFSVLDEVGTEKLSGVFHSFTGNIEQAQKALSYQNFKLSINGVVTFKNSGLDKVVSQIDKSNLVIETDAPYLTPTPYRGKRNEPNYVHLVAEKLADIYAVSKEEIENVTSQNAMELFNIGKLSS